MVSDPDPAVPKIAIAYLLERVATALKVPGARHIHLR